MYLNTSSPPQVSEGGVPPATDTQTRSSLGGIPPGGTVTSPMLSKTPVSPRVLQLPQFPQSSEMAQVPLGRPRPSLISWTAFLITCQHLCQLIRALGT